jgi:hypothetical protein
MVKCDLTRLKWMVISIINEKFKDWYFDDPMIYNACVL